MNIAFRNAMTVQDYLDWEVALVEQLKREPYLTFKTG